MGYSNVSKPTGSNLHRQAILSEPYHNYIPGDFTKYMPKFIFISSNIYNTTLVTAIRVSYIGCPTRYRTRHFFNNFTTNEDIATKFEAHYRHTTDTLQTHYRHIPFHFSHILKFRCNIFIGVRIIKEMQGSVASGTHCITPIFFLLLGLQGKATGLILVVAKKGRETLAYALYTEVLISP